MGLEANAMGSQPEEGKVKVSTAKRECRNVLSGADKESWGIIFKTTLSLTKEAWAFYLGTL